MVWWLACSTVARQSAVGFCLLPEHVTPPPVVHDRVNKGLGMSSLVYATEHIKDPVPLIEKSRAVVLVVGFLLVVFIT